MASSKRRLNQLLGQTHNRSSSQQKEGGRFLWVMQIVGSLVPRPSRPSVCRLQY